MSAGWFWFLGSQQSNTALCVYLDRPKFRSCACQRTSVCLEGPICVLSGMTQILLLCSPKHKCLPGGSTSVSGEESKSDESAYKNTLCLPEDSWVLGKALWLCVSIWIGPSSCAPLAQVTAWRVCLSWSQICGCAHQSTGICLEGPTCVCLEWSNFCGCAQGSTSVCLGVQLRVCLELPKFYSCAYQSPSVCLEGSILCLSRSARVL